MRVGNPEQTPSLNLDGLSNCTRIVLNVPEQYLRYYDLERAHTGPPDPRPDAC